MTEFETRVVSIIRSVITRLVQCDQHDDVVGAQAVPLKNINKINGL